MTGNKRKFNHHLTGFGELTTAIDSLEQCQGFYSSLDATGTGGGYKVKVFKIVNSELRHAQDYLREVGTVNLLQSIHIPVVKILLRVKAVADTRLSAACPTFTLIAACLRDRSLDQR